jgi:hypothetical protein
MSPLTSGPLTLPSPQRGEGARSPSPQRGGGVRSPAPFQGEGRVRVGR